MRRGRVTLLVAVVGAALGVMVAGQQAKPAAPLVKVLDEILELDFATVIPGLQPARARRSRVEPHGQYRRVPRWTQRLL